MLALAAWLLSLVAMLLAVPAFMLALECLLARAAERRAEPRAAGVPYVVVVPAHDEEAGLGRTLDGLLADLDADGRILVVADNCGDRTAEVARARGVEVLERFDDARRGKGHALAYAVGSLADAPPAVLVFVDADCDLERGTLGELVRACMQHDGPVQADYVLVPRRQTPREALSALAFLVRNRVRPLGLARLGGPCGLFGTGMAMPYPLFVSLPNAEGHLVEDMWLGIECALRGKAPHFVPTARVTSEAAPSDAATRRQRMRWEQGHLGVLRHDVPRLLAHGGKDALLLALDLAIPPLALLVALVSIIALAALALVALGGSALPSALALADLGLVAIAVLAAWARFGRAVLPARALLSVPGYVLWKIPVYLGLIRNRETSWNRTDRRPGDP